MSKVLVDPAVLEEAAKWLEVHSSSSGSAEAFAADALREAIAQPAEAEGVEAVEFWVLFDATTPVPYIKKMMPEGFLAFFDDEEDAIRAKLFHPGTDYNRVPYVRQSDHLAALSAVTAEVEAMRKDAERYRWLRMADWWNSPLCVIRYPKQQAKLGTDCPSRDRLDAAVDDAMQQP